MIFCQAYRSQKNFFLLNKAFFFNFISFVLLLGGALFIAEFPQPLLFPEKLVGALLVMFLGYLGLLCAKAPLSLILLLSVIVQLIFLGMPPFFNDFFRYLWDGKMSLHGINPFAYFPWAVHDAPALAHLAAVWYWDELFFKWTHTIYPPTLQILFWLSNLIREDSALVLKSIFFVCNLGSLFFGIKLLDALQRPRTNIAFLALNPLFLFETTASAHVEAVFVFLLILTLYFFQKHRPIFTGIALGAFALVKYIPVLLYPLFLLGKKDLKRGWRATGLALLVTALLLYMPFALRIDLSLLVESLRVYSADWIMSPGVFALLAWVAPTYTAAKATALALTLGAVVGIYWHYVYHQNVFRAAWQIFFVVLLFSSAIFSWYILWLVALIPFLSKKMTTVVLSGTFLLQYLLITFDAAQHRTFVYLQNGQIVWHQLLLWLPPVIILLYETRGFFLRPRNR